MMEYPSPPCFSENEKCIYPKARKISEASNDSVAVSDHSGQSTVNSIRYSYGADTVQLAVPAWTTGLRDS